MIDKLFPDFPREFGKKRVIVRSKDELYSLINKYNGKIDCYISVYARVDNPTIDKLFFDFDGDNALKIARQFHKSLMTFGWKHSIFFSGGGFHIYVFTDGKRLMYPKSALREAQLDLIGKAALRREDIDQHIIGDIRRITRIPNTFNIKPHRMRFCIPITGDELRHLSMKAIESSAQVQDFNKVEKVMINGLNLLSLEKYDKEPDLDLLGLDNYTTEKVTTDFDFLKDKLPPLILRMLKTKKCGWKDRYYTILALREAGFPMPLCVDICRKAWSGKGKQRDGYYDTFMHALKDERQFEYVYGRGNLFFPKWEFLEQEGYPITEEDKKFRFYK